MVQGYYCNPSIHIQTYTYTHILTHPSADDKCQNRRRTSIVVVVHRRHLLCAPPLENIDKSIKIFLLHTLSALYPSQTDICTSHPKTRDRGKPLWWFPKVTRFDQKIRKIECFCTLRAWMCVCVYLSGIISSFAIVSSDSCVVKVFSS